MAYSSCSTTRICSLLLAAPNPNEIYGIILALIFDMMLFAHHGKADYTHYQQWPESYQLCHSSDFNESKPPLPSPSAPCGFAIVQILMRAIPRPLPHMLSLDFATVTFIVYAFHVNSAYYIRGIDYQNCICAGTFSGSTVFAGRPMIEYARSHCARVTKIARTDPSDGTLSSNLRKCVCCLANVTHGLA